MRSKEFLLTQHMHAITTLSQASNYENVRVMGTLVSYDVKHNVAVLDDGDKMMIDTTLLGNFQYRIGSRYQVFGEMNDGTLMAKVTTF